MAEKTNNKMSDMIMKYFPYVVLIIIMVISLHVRLVGFNYKYLRNIDSYVFYRYMNYTVENGKLPDYDPLMLAPYGKNLTAWNMFYVWLGAKSYELTRLFINIPLWRFLVYFPAILATLMAIPAYIIGKEMYDDKAGLIAAALILFSPVIMSRTLGGDPDSDAIVLLMSLLTISSVSLDLKRKNYFTAILTGIVFSLFAWTWVGFWYVFYLYLGSSLILWFVRKDFSYIRNFIISTFVFLTTAYLLTGMFLLPYLVKTPIKTIGLFGGGGIKSEEGQFPNVYVSVAEMQSNSVRSLLQQIGGYLFVPGIFGLIYLIYSYIKTKRHLEALSLFSLWVIGFTYASLTAVRFSIFLTIPLSFLSAIMFSKFLRFVEGENLEV